VNVRSRCQLYLICLRCKHNTCVEVVCLSVCVCVSYLCITITLAVGSTTIQCTRLLFQDYQTVSPTMVTVSVSHPTLPLTLSAWRVVTAAYNIRSLTQLTVTVSALTGLVYDPTRNPYWNVSSLDERYSWPVEGRFIRGWYNNKNVNVHNDIINFVISNHFNTISWLYGAFYIEFRRIYS